MSSVSLLGCLFTGGGEDDDCGCCRYLWIFAIVHSDQFVADVVSE